MTDPSKLVIIPSERVIRKRTAQHIRAALLATANLVLRFGWTIAKLPIRIF